MYRNTKARTTLAGLLLAGALALTGCGAGTVGDPATDPDPNGERRTAIPTTPAVESTSLPSGDAPSLEGGSVITTTDALTTTP